MPLYEYECKECKRRFETLQKIDAEPLQSCIHCSGEVEKLISVSSFQFKGSGWYITDYKNKSGKSDSKEESSNKKEYKQGKDNNATTK